MIGNPELNPVPEQLITATREYQLRATIDITLEGTLIDTVNEIVDYNVTMKTVYN